MASSYSSDLEASASEICRIGRSLFDRGYVHATAGNISVRLSNGNTLITPTDACLGDLEPETLALIAPDGTQLAGERASKTLVLHRAIYAAQLQARCIIHTHSTHLVALSLGGVWRDDDVLPPITPYYAMKVGHVPLIPYRRPGDPEVAILVAQAAARAAERGHRIHAVLLERLGPVVWHSSPRAASATLEELEETAKLWLLTQRSPAPLSQEQLTELRQHSAGLW